MQEAYCQSYIKTPENQTQAAINAGFSPNTAAVKASVMMRDERIQKRIAELMEERNKRMRVSADYVLMRLVEIDQMDVIELNEAFASQAIACMRDLKMDASKVNPYGGAMALGHPMGATGAFLTCKALDYLQDPATKGKYAMVTMCIGGGMGACGIYEMCD